MYHLDHHVSMNKKQKVVNASIIILKYGDQGDKTTPKLRKIGNKEIVYIEE